MDRASIHFRPDVIELVERHGGRIMPTAPYCPWDNAVEYLHSWVKSWLKRNERFVEQVGAIEGISAAFREVPDMYALRTIQHCGY
jgi:transposase